MTIYSSETPGLSTTTTATTTTYNSNNNDKNNSDQSSALQSLCEEIPLVTGEFSFQRVSNAESVFLSRRLNEQMSDIPCGALH